MSLPGMKTDFVNPFVSAAFQTIEAELGTKVERGELSIQESYYTANDVTVVIGVTGAVRGTVLYGVSNTTAKKIVGAMMGQRVVILDSLAESALAELGNVIAGLASGELERRGYPCTISPPAVILGKGTIISTLNLKRLVVPLLTEYGELEISLSLTSDGTATLGDDG